MNTFRRAGRLAPFLRLAPDAASNCNERHYFTHMYVVGLLTTCRGHANNKWRRRRPLMLGWPRWNSLWNDMRNTPRHSRLRETIRIYWGFKWHCFCFFVLQNFLEDIFRLFFCRINRPNHRKSTVVLLVLCISKDGCEHLYYPEFQKNFPLARLRFRISFSPFLCRSL